MNVKKWTAAVLSCALVGALLAGCGNRTQDIEHGERIKIGILNHLNASEEKFNDLMQKVDETWTGKLSRAFVYFDNLSAMQMALESGQVQEMSIYKSVAKYLTDRNDKMQVVDEKGLKLADAFCCAVRAEDKELLADLNRAIKEMKDDGTLDKLIKKYITDVPKDTEPPAVPIPEHPGAVTLKVAVTGDLPPLDLVRADGKAAGFNTAVLKEVNDRLNKDVEEDTGESMYKRTGKGLTRDFEIVQVDAAARAAALTAKKVDVVFWVAVPEGDSKLPPDLDKPDGVELTIPYYKDDISHIAVKK